MRVKREFYIEKKKAEYNKIKHLMRHHEIWRYVGDPVWRIYEDDPLYAEVVRLCRESEGKLQIVCMDSKVEMTSEEEKEAVAFLMGRCDHWCEEYEDTSNDEHIDRCRFCHNFVREKEPLYIAPKGYIKKHENDYGLLNVDMYDIEEKVFLPNLKEKLVELGIEEDLFLPVITKRKKILGYILYPKNVLGEGEFQNDTYQLKKTCKCCGRTYMADRKTDYYTKNFLKKEALSKLQDVNHTYEFYSPGSQKIIISKRMKEMIQQYVPKAKFDPIFLEK